MFHIFLQNRGHQHRAPHVADRRLHILVTIDPCMMIPKESTRAVYQNCNQRQSLAGLCFSARVEALLFCSKKVAVENNVTEASHCLKHRRSNKHSFTRAR
jgi:hypothetical protein